MTPELRATLRSAMAENDSHLQKIRRASQLLSESFPLSVESLSDFGEDQIALLDQFIYRFTKMQDSLGTRFLPSIFSLLEGEDRPRPFLDVLNRLEQLEVLTSVETWQFFRNLRNKLAHDYPETRGQTVETLNVLHSDIETFLQLYLRVRDACTLRLSEEPS